MPNYGYECTKQKCAHSFTECKPMSDCRKPSKCPKCKSKAVRIVSLRATEPTFTQKLYPFHHTGLGETVTSEKQMAARCKELGFLSKHEGAQMNRKHEKFLMDRRTK